MFSGVTRYGHILCVCYEYLWMFAQLYSVDFLRQKETGSKIFYVVKMPIRISKKEENSRP